MFLGLTSEVWKASQRNKHFLMPKFKQPILPKHLKLRSLRTVKAKSRLKLEPLEVGRSTCFENFGFSLKCWLPQIVFKSFAIIL